MHSEKLIILLAWMCIAVAVMEAVIFILKRVFIRFSFVQNYMKAIELAVIFIVVGLVLWLQ